MSERIRVMVKPAGLPPHIEYVTNDLKSLQSLVGGYIETVTLASDLVVICDEEGRLKGKPYNCRIANVDFVGDIALVGVEGEEFDDCLLRVSDAKYFITRGEEA